MSAPVCSVHLKPMKLGNKGGYFCTSKMSDGSWCTQKGSGAAPVSQTAAAAAYSPPLPTNGNGHAPGYLLVVAVLDFAGKVYQGTGKHEEAAALARSTFLDWKGEL